MSQHAIAREFFDTYTRALLARDAKAIASHYAAPALIVFPQQLIAVSDVVQTEGFLPVRSASTRQFPLHRLALKS